VLLLRILDPDGWDETDNPLPPTQNPPKTMNAPNEKCYLLEQMKLKKESWLDFSHDLLKGFSDWFQLV